MSEADDKDTRHLWSLISQFDRAFQKSLILGKLAAERHQRARDDRELAQQELKRIHQPGLRRQKLERLVAFCPRGCRVVTVYQVGARMLVELRGDILADGGALVADLPPTDDYISGFNSFVPHPAHWLDERIAGRVWTVDCRRCRGAYSVSGRRLLEETPSTGRHNIAVSEVAP